MRLRTHLSRLPLVSLLGLLALVAACSGSDAPAPGESNAELTNLLLVILDDVGVDSVGCYGAMDARTPCLDRLAAEGVRFENAWANPMCSPTRATLMTGRYSFRTGIGRIVDHAKEGEDLALSELCLPEALPGTRTALLGKWHLGARGAGLDHPKEQGFEVFQGTFGNVGEVSEPERYFEYEEIVEGKARMRQQYASSAVVDDALAAVAGFGADPWFVTLSFHAPHVPFHAPPDELLSEPFDGARVQSDKRGAFLAMLEALDTELDRLLRSLPKEVAARTHVMVVGDNGTPKRALPAGVPLNRGKGSIHDPGIHVPLIVTGPAVKSPGRASAALVNTTDLFASGLELLGAPVPETAEDAVSFVDVLRDPEASGERQWILSERFWSAEQSPRGKHRDHVAIRGPRYKRMEYRELGQTLLFDLVEDPAEERDLIRIGGGEAGLEGEAKRAFTELGAALSQLKR